MANDGSIHIKSTCSDKFWTLRQNWICADSIDTNWAYKATWFRPFKVDDQTIALQNLVFKKFCKRLTKEGMTSCLNADVSSISKEVQLRVEEPILKREIYNIKYKLDDSRIYDESVVVVVMNSASNFTQVPQALDVKLSYVDTTTNTWKTNSSLKFGAKATTDFRIPCICEGKIELSTEYQEGDESGTSNTKTTAVEVIHKAAVPPMTKVTVQMIATKGKCDVPFTFTQKDTLYNGVQLNPVVRSGTYTGSNYYNVEFLSKEEPLISSST